MNRTRARILLCTLLVVGSTFGTSSRATEPTGKRWLDMHYGPYLTASVEAPGHEERNFAYKGILVRVGGDVTHAAGRDEDATMMFDTDLLRYTAGWTGGFLKMRCIAFDGSHGTHSSVKGDVAFTTPMGPGWARTSDGSFADPRKLPYGPLPRDWAHWNGLFLHEDQVVLSYTVGEAKVLELPAFDRGKGSGTFLRHLQIAGAKVPLVVQVADTSSSGIALYSRAGKKTEDPLASSSVVIVGKIAAPQSEITVLATTGAPAKSSWSIGEDGARLTLPAGADSRARRPARTSRLTISYWRGSAENLTAHLGTLALRKTVPMDLTALTKGGPARWPQKLETKGKIGTGDKVFAVDEIVAPFENPWNSWIRLGGFDFFEGGTRAAVCTWMGDVFLVDGIDEDLDKLTWHRIASGLFQPLGLKISGGKIYVLGRDQITLLHDLNGDGETDFYENFNNDAQVTEHFHEFAMDLQTDAAGDFYYMKGGRHAKDAVVPQHGTLMKVSKDGKKAEILATGFRAPNGLCVNDDGTFISSDQEGHWTPMNRINWVKKGGFYGYNWSYFEDGKKRDSFDNPICWLHKRYDRSPAAQVWVRSKKWGALDGQLLSFSYGTGEISQILHEKVDGEVQGGAMKLEVPMFPTGVMRARFHKGDGQLYVCGLFGWAGNRTQSGGFYRVRHTGKTAHLPIGLNATDKGMILTFSEPLNAERSGVASRYSIERWDYRWRQNYGSKDYKVSNGKVGRDKVKVTGAKLSKDKRSVLLEIEDMKPCMQMHIRYKIQGADGTRISHEIYNSIHKVGPWAPHAGKFE